MYITKAEIIEEFGEKGIPAGLSDEHISKVISRTDKFVDSYLRSASLETPLTDENAISIIKGACLDIKPNEVPAILEKDEEVLKRTDPRHRYNLGSGSSSAQPINIHNSIDNASIASAMEGAEGARMVINHIKANASVIKAHLT